LQIADQIPNAMARTQDDCDLILTEEKPKDGKPQQKARHLGSILRPWCILTLKTPAI
jgi:hypothetical protein